MSLPVKIDGIWMNVDSLYYGFPRMTVSGVRLMDDTMYCFSDYTHLEFNGRRFNMYKELENLMFKHMFLTALAIEEL